MYITDKGNTDSALPSQWSALVSEIGVGGISSRAILSIGSEILVLRH